MIKLRELKETDTKYMIEWMHDKDIQRFFKKNMLDITIEDAKQFCIAARIPNIISDGISIHYAIVDDSDEYLGTISLKDINLNDKTAEYAIVIRRKARGKGVAFKATQLVLNKAFNEFGLHRVYLNVIADNERAVRLYEKIGFVFEGEFREHLYKEGKYVNWKWYGLLAKEYSNNILGKG